MIDLDEIFLNILKIFLIYLKFTLLYCINRITPAPPLPVFINEERIILLIIFFLEIRYFRLSMQMVAIASYLRKCIGIILLCLVKIDYFLFLRNLSIFTNVCFFPSFPSSQLLPINIFYDFL